MSFLTTSIIISFVVFILAFILDVRNKDVKLTVEHYCVFLATVRTDRVQTEVCIFARKQKHIEFAISVSNPIGQTIFFFVSNRMAMFYDVIDGMTNTWAMAVGGFEIEQHSMQLVT